jgi:hypothetical protein
VAGSLFLFGKSFDIVWTGGTPSENVAIFYHIQDITGNFGMWSQTELPSTVANSDTYTWNVPAAGLVTLLNYQLRIISTTDSNNYNASGSF